MKFPLVAAVFVIFGVSQVSCDEGEETPGLFPYLQHIKRFFVQMQEEFKTLPEENAIKTVFGKAITSSSACFQKEIVSFSDRMQQIGGVIAKSITSVVQKSGPTDSGSQKFPTSLNTLSDFLKLPGVSNYINFFSDGEKIKEAMNKPEIRKDLWEIFDKIKQALQNSGKCFMDTLKEGMPEEEVNKIKELWAKSETATDAPSK